MSKHTTRKYSQTQLPLHNKAGKSPAAPAAGTNTQNQYR